MKRLLAVLPLLLLFPIIAGAQIDTTKWYVANGPDTVWVPANDCFQAANVTAGGGVLTETGKVASPQVCSGINYTTADIGWKIYNFTYGYIETRMKFAGGTGPWPAFWMIGAACQPAGGSNGCNWPSDASDAAEIDIAEILNNVVTRVNQETHITGGGQQCQPTVTDVSANYHTYGLLWTAGNLTWYIDGVATCTATGASVPAHAQFLMIDLYLGGAGGSPINNATLPQTNSVTYVRACAGATTPTCTASQAQQTGNFDDEFGATGGNTYFTNSTSQPDVADCISGAGVNTCHLGSPTGTQATHTMVNGDTINIAAGTATWTTTGVTVPLGVSGTIIGSGTPNSTSGTPGASSSCDTGTVITLSDITSANNAMFVANPTIANQSSSVPALRFSCMDVKFGTGPVVVFAINGTCNNTSCAAVRLDNMTYDNFTNQNHDGDSYGMSGLNNVFGVVDHNTINGTAGGTYLEFAEVSHSTFLGSNGGWFGDNSWASPPMYGTSNFLFYENNIFNQSGCCETEGGPDPGPQNYLNYRGGTRVVVRHNTFNFSGGPNFALGWHGTETGGRPRSGMEWEFYDNQINVVTAATGNLLGPRGGTGLMWGNTINSSIAGNPPLNVLDTNRSLGPTGRWPACDGWAVEDDVDSNASASNPAWTGTVTAVSAVSHNYVTITLANGSGTRNPNPWTPAQWNPLGAPYSIHDTTKSATAGYGQEIFENGSNTIVINSGAGGPGQWTPSVGDTIIITRAFACMDQGGGRGPGAYFSYSTFPSPPFTSSANEISLPVYTLFNSWSNTLPGGSGVSSTSQRVIDNRDMYSETAGQGAQTSTTSPFNGLPDIQPVTSWSCTHGVSCILNVPSTANFPVSDTVIISQLAQGVGQGFASEPTGSSVISKTSTSITVANNAGYTDTGGPGGYVATRGAGHGTLANRPTTCTPSPWTSSDPWGQGQYGVAYAELDGSGNLIQIDWCIAANTWSTTSTSPASYVPAVYPHSLIVPAVTISPSSESCGSVNVGSSATCGTLVLSNNSGVAITISSVSYGGTNAADFSNSVAPCTGTIPNGSTCNVVPRFTLQ
jgi:beta-glucanase (GH16 family)